MQGACVDKSAGSHNAQAVLKTAKNNFGAVAQNGEKEPGICTVHILVP
jgi:hypothetical protein